MLTLVATLIALALGQGATAPTQVSEAEQAIRAIVAGQVTAWNAGDAKAYATVVSPDVSFTNLFGMVMYGRDAFEQRHAAIFATFYKGTVKSQVVHRVRFVTPDVALVDIDNEVRGVRTMPRGIALPADGIIRSQLLEVFAKRDGRWWVEAYHNVDTKPTN